MAAIAHVDVLTKTATAEIGTQLREARWCIKKLRFAQGTSIAVKNLFNIPARRNF